MAEEAENLELGIVAETINRESCKEVKEEKEDCLLPTDSDEKEGKVEEENDFGQVAKTNQEDGAT